MLTTNFNAHLGLFAAALALGSPLVPAALYAAPSSSVYTPAPGSRERAELMDALRGPFAQTHHETVTFKIDRLKVGGGYAYLEGSALSANGKPARSLAEMGGSVSAFYQKRNGHWTVVKWGSYGGTDLVDYARSHFPNAPRALFSGSAPTAPAASSAGVHTPAPGSRERAELMDALRGPFAVRYHETVTFEIDRLKVGDGYAYLDAVALGANGKPARSLADMGGVVSAFYRKTNGHWTVVNWGSYGGTDLIDECKQKYPSAPRALFP